MPKQIYLSNGDELCEEVLDIYYIPEGHYSSSVLWNISFTNLNASMRNALAACVLRLIQWRQRFIDVQTSSVTFNPEHFNILSMHP
jgi:hypothetical protein